MENFINEFKIYCENVEDTKGLEIIKEELFQYELNLEFFIQDNLEDVLLEDDIVKEAFRLSELLKEKALNGKLVNKTKLREIWKLTKHDSLEDLKIKFEYVCNRCCELLYSKYNIEHTLSSQLTEEQLEKWYVDLYQLFDKYGI